MPTRRRDQGGQSVDQFERRHEQADTAAGARLEALIDRMFGVDLAQSFEQTAPLECAQQSAADVTLDVGQLLGAQHRHFVTIQFEDGMNSL